MVLNASDYAGTPEILTWREYMLGSVIVLVCLAIIVCNVLFLVCFYRLRHHRFVKNALSVVSLLVADLINAVILTPTVLAWFTIAPPFKFETCVLLSLPFVVTNYISLLNMFCFCVYRLLVIRQVASGNVNIAIRKYYIVTIIIWIFTPIIIAVPYIMWGNKDRLLAECRRNIFRDLSSGLKYLSVLFDVPLVIMNVSFLAAWLRFKKYSTKVSPNVIEVSVVRSFHPGTSISSSCSCPSSNDFWAERRVYKPYRLNERKVTASSIGTSLCYHNAFTNETTFGSRERVYDIHDLEEIDSVFTDSRTVQSETRDGVLEADHKQSRQYRNSRRSTENSKDDAKKSGHVCGEVSNNGERNQPHTKLSITLSTSNRMNQGDDSCLISELKQIFVTMGILIAIFNISTLPLILDINIAAADHSFYMPNVLNSMCFLNAFFNPVVYLVRMDLIRKEMKTLFSKAWGHLCRCGMSCNSGSID